MVGIEVELDGTDENGQPTYDGAFFLSGKYYIPVIRYSPEAIFANRVPILNANFLRPASTNTDTKNPEDNMVALRNVAAGWYVAIRMISIIGLLSVLVYLSIRMMLSGVAADKAKYKKMLMSWLVAMCLLFFLHYFMSFIMTLSETITGFVGTAGDTAINVTVGDNETRFSTNMIGLVRFQVQHTDALFKITYMTIYVLMVFYTIKFTWVYLKRMVSMAFLTLIAPLVALTYPIDKAGDGKAQGFDMWLKEYVYNALVQPLHCLIYTIFSVATIELAKTNPLIAVLIFPLMGYAEKFLKSLLGFTKAGGGTQPSIAGAIGAHAIGTMVGNLAKRGRANAGREKPRTKDSNGADLTVGAPNALDDSDYGYDANALNFPGGGATKEQGSGGEQNPQGDPQGGGLPSGNEQKPNGNPPGGTDINDVPAGQQDEFINGMQDILNDPNTSDEEKAYAQEQLDNYQNTQQQWQAGNTEEPQAPAKEPETGTPWTYTPPEPTTLGEAIGRDLSGLGERASAFAGKKISGFKTGIGNSWKFARNKDNYREQKLGEAKDAIKDKANSAALAGYKGIKRNLRGAAYAAKPLAYKAGKAALGTAVSLGTRGVAAGVVGAATWGMAAAMTGDLSQATTLASTAAGGTYYGLGKAGDAATGKAIEDFEVKHDLSTDYKAAFQRGKYGSEAKARNEKEQREWEHSNEFNQFLRAKYQGKAKEDMEKAREAMIAYHKLGVKDNDQAFKLYKAEEAVQNNLQAVGGMKPTRREMVAAMKTVKGASERVWTGDKTAGQSKRDSLMNSFKGTQQEKEKKVARRMGLAQIIYDNGTK